MQLKSNKISSLKIALTAATTALLGSSASVSANSEFIDDSWSFDAAMLYYGEIDRVTAGEAMFAATKTFEDDSILNMKLTLDGLTGASPNGAVAQPTVQTFTKPSGNGEYQTSANKTPTYDGFKDTRVQFNTQWTQPFAENYTYSTGLHFSKEYDYLSLGVNASLAFDFNRKNSTFSVGGSFFQDTYSPVGGIPKPLAIMLPGSGLEGGDDDDNSFNPNDPTRISKDDTKSTADIILGFTQVINRRLITQFNYSYSAVDGYLNDPYKRLSMVNTNGETQQYLYENRPRTREKQSVFGQAKYHFTENILDVSYRYMWDDWKIESHTIDSKFYVPLGNDSYLEPHFRVYQQSAASFYQPFLNESQPLPIYASSDLRIGEMTTYTLGLKYGMFLNGEDELAFRLEYYNQTPTNAGFDEPGVLAEQDLYEPVQAIIAQVTYSF